MTAKEIAELKEFARAYGFELDPRLCITFCVIVLVVTS